MERLQGGVVQSDRDDGEATVTGHHLAEGTRWYLLREACDARRKTCCQI